MGIIKNSIDFGSGFNIKSQGPIDSRMVVENVNDLTTVWDKDVPAYIGMVVSVKETGDIYVLVGGENIVNINNYAKDISNWKKQHTDLPNMEDYVTDGELNTVLNSYATNETVSNISDKIGNVESSLNDTIDILNTTNETVSSLSTKVGNVENSLNNSYYTIEQVNGLIGNINSFNILVVDELPETGDSYTIYFVGVDGGVQNDVKNEYIYIDGKWELIGNTRIDLSDYVTDGELNTALSVKQDVLKAGDNVSIANNTISVDLSGKQDVLTVGDNVSIDGNTISVDLSSKQDVISNLDEIIRGANLGTTALQSIPDEYITETELEGKGYLTEHQDLTGYVTDGELNTALSGKQDVISNLDEIISGAALGTTALQSIPDEYVTETELEAKGYLTEHQDLTVLTESISKKQDTLIVGENITIDGNTISAIVDLSSKQDVISNLDEIISGAALGATALQSIPDEYATKTFVINEIAKIQLEGGEIDLSGFVERDELKDYAKIEDIPSLDGYAKIDDIPSLDGYAKIEDIPSLDGYLKSDDLNGYVTEEEIKDVVYKSELYNYILKTELPEIENIVYKSDIEGVALKSDLDNVLMKSDIDVENVVYKSELPNFDIFLTEEDIENVALKSDLDNVLMKSDIDVENVVYKSELTNFATKEEIKDVAYKSELDNYILKTELPEIENIVYKSEIENVAYKSDLNKYATKEEIKDVAYKSDIVNVVYKDELTNVAYKSEFDNYISKAELPEIENIVYKSDIENVAYKSDLENVVYKDELTNVVYNEDLNNTLTEYAKINDIPDIDISEYYTKTEVNSLISNIESLIGSASALTEEILG